MTDQIWDLHRGDGPLVATAIHDGHGLRDEAAACVALTDDERLREEDPFTSSWTAIAPTRIVGLRSRFEVDLNRPREAAVYREPADAWGLEVWAHAPAEELVERSLAEYDAFYRALDELYRELQAQHGCFVVFDLHSYNHRREGPGRPAADPQETPQVNVGTGTMTDRAPWAPLIDRFMTDLAGFDFPGGRLDVRENVRFRGGHFPRWTHERFPDVACVLSIEVKKFFMDEWTGEPYPPLVEAVGAALAATIPGVLQELDKL